MLVGESRRTIAHGPSLRNFTGYHSEVQNNESQPPYHIASVDRALRLLILLRSHPRLRVAEAAAELGVAPSTAHRLLGVLVYRGFAAQDPRTRAYLPGPALIGIGMGAVANLDVRRKAAPLLELLVAETGETASLQVLEGREVRFLDSVESLNAVRVSSRAGVVLPAALSSGGKVLLAKASPDTLDRLYPEEIVPAFPPAPASSRSALLAELEDVRELGYSVNHAEKVRGLVAVGMAVPSWDDRPLAALSVAGPTARMDDYAVDQAVEALRRATRRLAAELSR